MQIARRYRVHGRVQGVGYRYFVQHAAARLGIRGWVRNLDDGSVEVYAVGSRADHDELGARLHRGPSMADVRGVEVQEAALEKVSDFRITA
jgi:acylphosphatase